VHPSTAGITRRSFVPIASSVVTDAKGFSSSIPLGPFLRRNMTWRHPAFLCDVLSIFGRKAVSKPIKGRKAQSL
jgi:hypothetical protein